MYCFQVFLQYIYKVEKRVVFSLHLFTPKMVSIAAELTLNPNLFLIFMTKALSFHNC